MRTRPTIPGRGAAVSMKAALAVAIVGLVLAFLVPPCLAGSRLRSDAVVRVVSGGERIASIRTSRGVTTMLSLPSEAKEAVCGDLFDAQTGNGCFVIQRSGRDLFLKPLKATGETNLFVKTEAATYAFDLVVVPSQRAMRIVFVDTAAPDRALVNEREQLARDRAALDTERAQFASTREAATVELDRMREAIGEEAHARAEAIARTWLAEGAALAVPIARRSARGRDGLEITLGEAALRLGDRTFIRCTVRNRGPRAAVIASAELSGRSRSVAAVNKVAPAGGEVSMALSFDGPPGPGGELRLLDATGTELVAVRAFR
jgi:hypothetical protein